MRHFMILSVLTAVVLTVPGYAQFNFRNVARNATPFRGGGSVSSQTNYRPGNTMISAPANVNLRSLTSGFSGLAPTHAAGRSTTGFSHNHWHTASTTLPWAGQSHWTPPCVDWKCLTTCPLSSRCCVTPPCVDWTCVTTCPLSSRCSVTPPNPDVIVAGSGSDIDAGAPETEYGLSITQVLQGSAAAKAGLKVGDVLVTIAGQRVQSFDEMVAAVSRASGATDVVFLNIDSSKLERMPITPSGGKLGVAVEPTPLK